MSTAVDYAGSARIFCSFNKCLHLSARGELICNLPFPPHPLLTSPGIGQPIILTNCHSVSGACCRLHFRRYLVHHCQEGPVLVSWSDCTGVISAHEPVPTHRSYVPRLTPTLWHCNMEGPLRPQCCWGRCKVRCGGGIWGGEQFLRFERLGRKKKRNLAVMVQWDVGTLCIQPSEFHASARV